MLGFAWPLTVWVLPKWGNLETVSSNIALKLIEVHMFECFHQPPFWQYLVSGWQSCGLVNSQYFQVFCPRANFIFVLLC